MILYHLIQCVIFESLSVSTCELTNKGWNFSLFYCLRFLVCKLIENDVKCGLRKLITELREYIEGEFLCLFFIKSTMPALEFVFTVSQLLAIEFWGYENSITAERSLNLLNEYILMVFLWKYHLLNRVPMWQLIEYSLTLLEGNELRSLEFDKYIL